MKIISLSLKILLWSPIIIMAVFLILFLLLINKGLYLLNDGVRFIIENFLRDMKKSSEGTAIEDIINKIKFD